MGDIAIYADNLSKLYRIGARQARHDTLRDLLAGAFTGPVRRARSSLQRFRPQTSDDLNTNSGDSPEVSTIWALKDVSFEVRQGEVIGIIGRNGAGKSTLLKILSRITRPTQGRAELTGRIASLLEVGTGFHAELTGRENVYLNGAVLGMRKAEIDRKFDEIVDFSGVERFIDTPMKRFSSGMQVRLAFSVAAHLEPEILLVDEVLAVGDAEFQAKCLGKIRDVTGAGRTVLLVSHNMAAVRNLCRRTLWIDNGGLKADTDAETALAGYLNQNSVDRAVISGEEIEGAMEGWIDRANPTVRVREVAITEMGGSLRNTFRSDEPIRVSVTYECLTPVSDLRVVVHVVDDDGRPILTSQNVDGEEARLHYQRAPGLYRSICLIPPDTFGEKRFYVSVSLCYPKVEEFVLNRILAFDVSFLGYNNVQYGSFKDTFLRPRLQWQTETVAHAG